MVSVWTKFTTIYLLLGASVSVFYNCKGSSLAVLFMCMQRWIVFYNQSFQCMRLLSCRCRYSYIDTLYTKMETAATYPNEISARKLRSFVCIFIKCSNSRFVLFNNINYMLLNILSLKMCEKCGNFNNKWLNVHQTVYDNHVINTCIQQLAPILTPLNSID